MRVQAKRNIFLTFIALLLFAGSSWAQNSGRYIVTIRRPVNNAVANAGGQVIHQYKTIPAIAIEIPSAAIPGLLRNPNVVAIEPDLIMWATGNVKKTPPGLTKKPPKDEDPPAQPEEILPWGVDRIDAEQVWDQDGDGQLDTGAITGAGINVAVIDTGIDYTHPDLAGNYASGINIINTRKSPKDDNGHGTHVAGTIAAIDNDFGVIGVAPQATLYAVKVLNRSGYGSLSDIMAGIEWCIGKKNIDVINMSLGGYPTKGSLLDLEFEAVCDLALGSGIIVVASAGNEGLSEPAAPARYSSVISVGATNPDNSVAYFSNRGFDIAAPGVNIESTIPGGSYAYDWSGTSMACPHVVGTVALMLDAGLTDLKKDIYGIVDALATVPK